MSYTLVCTISNPENIEEITLLIKDIIESRKETMQEVDTDIYDVLIRYRT